MNVYDKTNRDGAGRRHGGDVAVAELPHRADPLASGRARRSRPGPRCCAPTPGTRRGWWPAAPTRASASSSMKAWIRRPRSTRLVGVVRHAEQDEGVGQAHEPSPMRRMRCARSVISRERIVVRVDHVLEEMGAEVHHLAKTVPVDFAVPDERTDLMSRGCRRRTAGGAAHRRGSSPHTSRVRHRIVVVGLVRV